jgi:DNA-binding Xre family transcriptional regulator
MTRKMGIRWHLRELMAARGMYMTSDLVPLLAERGVQLSREQVYRLVTQQPERLNVYVLAALCDLLACSPSDLIEPVVEAPTTRTRVARERGSADVRTVRPTRARILPGTRDS